MLGEEHPTVPKRADASLQAKRVEKIDISLFLGGWKWKATVTVDNRRITISKGSAWEGRRAKSDIISIIERDERDEEDPTFPSLAYSLFKKVEAILRFCFCFFFTIYSSKSLRLKFWKTNTLPLGKFPWQSFIWFPCVVGYGLRWHPSQWQSCGPPLLQLSSDCNATSSKPKAQQLPWKHSHWLQRILDPDSHSGQTLDIPGQPKQPLLTAAAVVTQKDSRDTYLMCLGSYCPKQCNGSFECEGFHSS